jgi:hypothetical protein
VARPSLRSASVALVKRVKHGDFFAVVLTTEANEATLCAAGGQKQTIFVPPGWPERRKSNAYCKKAEMNYQSHSFKTEIYPRSPISGNMGSG